MSEPKQRRHSLPNISPPTSSLQRYVNSSQNTLLDTTTSRAARSNTSVKTPLTTPRQSNNAPTTTKARRHSLAQPPTFANSSSTNRRLSPLPETGDQSVHGITSPATDINVTSLVESYLKDADMHLKLGKIPDGSALLATVLNEMKLGTNEDSSENDSNIYDVRGQRDVRHSNDDAFSEKRFGSVMSENSDVPMKVNTSPKRK